MPPLKRSDVTLEATWKRETTFASWEAWDRQFEKAKKDLPDAVRIILQRGFAQS